MSGYILDDLLGVRARWCNEIKWKKWIEEDEMGTVNVDE